MISNEDYEENKHLLWSEISKSYLTKGELMFLIICAVILLGAIYLLVTVEGNTIML